MLGVSHLIGLGFFLRMGTMESGDNVIQLKPYP